tara:strand:- start:3471 stop:4412 length:942 start_codon:yes stop_codon:yes gene_type:complete
MKRIKNSLYYLFIALLSTTACEKDNSNTTNHEEMITVYRIPVVVHIIHNGEPIGTGANISYEQIVSQIDVLNEDFRKKNETNGDSQNANGADTQIEFVLSTSAPDGTVLPEPGVDRIDGGRSEWPKGAFRNPIETIIKPNTYWSPDYYFNIWTVNFGGFSGRDLLGYAQFPDNSGLEGLNDIGGSEETDGIVIGYKYFGSSEKGSFSNLVFPFDLGRTATHEVGHWLGLRHIWGDGDCSFDDYCMDTPNSAAPNYGCPINQAGCETVAMIENYMDYTDDACMNTFTEDQKKRMLTVLQNSPRRNYIIQQTESY